MEKENQEQAKHEIGEVDYDRDHELAAALQQQENDVEMLTESEEDEDEDEEDEDDDGADESYNLSTTDYEDSFFTSQELADLELVEEEEEEEDEELEEEEDDDEELEEDSNLEEDEIDPDELSYEDLVALGEEVGQENQGLSLEEILPILSPYICKSVQSNTNIDRCVICQAEYEEGENLVALRCDHPFHACCITPWLQIKKTCPICSKEVIKQKAE